MLEFKFITVKHEFVRNIFLLIIFKSEVHLRSFYSVMNESVASPHNSVHISNDGFAFVYHSSRGNVNYYRCKQCRTQLACPAKYHFNKDTNEEVYTKEHNHPPPAAQTAIHEFEIQSFEEYANDNYNRFSNDHQGRFRAYLQYLNDNSVPRRASLIPDKNKIDYIFKKLSDERMRGGIGSLSRDVVLTVSEETLVHYINSRPDEYYIFSSPNMIRWARLATAVSVDGTFDSAPLHYKQLLIFQGYIPNHGYFPLAFVPLNSKKLDQYERVFKLVDTFLQLSHKKDMIFISDFEDNFYTASVHAFGVTEDTFQGCFFHFAQILRKLLFDLYGKNPNREQRLAYYILRGLPFLPYNVTYHFVQL